MYLIHPGMHVFWGGAIRVKQPSKSGIGKQRGNTLIRKLNLNLCANPQAKIRYMSEFDRIEAEAIPHSKAVEMRGRTSMWYMLESAFMDPGAAKTLYTQFLTVTGHILVISGPALYPWNLAVMWKSAFQAYKCEVLLCFVAPFHFAFPLCKATFSPLAKFTTNHNFS